MSREYRFDRYRKGRKMAEGLVLTKPTTVEQAMETVYLLAGPSDTFVLREDLACLAAVEAERDAALAEVERLREDAARARWCEEKKASVFWSILAMEWRVAVYDEAYNSLYTSKANRNAAIDAARGRS